MSDDKLKLSEQEWRERLDPEAYAVLREEATERAFTGCLWSEKREGAYDCRGCGTRLFVSGAKYESGSGWPSFTRPSENDRVATREDESHGMRRIEILCARCDGHLGHVFDDAPQTPTGKRFCINSVSIKFTPAGEKSGG